MKSIKSILQIAAIFILFNVLIFFIGWNVWEWLTISFHLQNLYIYCFIIVLLSYSFVIGRFSKHLSIFRTIGYIWFGFFQYCLLLLPLADLLIFMIKMTSSSWRIAIFPIGLSVLCLMFIILSYGLFNAYSPIVRKYAITIPKKNANINELRVAVASDMHFGRLSGVSHLKRLVKIIKGIKPDLILLPGDIIDDEAEPFIDKKMGAIMAELQAPLGVFGVLGNHEYYGGQIPTFIDLMNDINITILTDEVITIGDSFHLLGRKDKTDKNRKSFAQLLEDVDPSYPIIAMDHQPQDLEAAQKCGVDILLSGHTHRGQMAPNHLITKKMYELDWGYLKKEQLHAFVSSGFGFWGPPFRIGSRSEVLEIHIKFI
ncbi:MAG: metallophosphoesterase [Bacillota bacterium]|nr:metallophosphoesterase [Bacillota bacterium]